MTRTHQYVLISLLAALLALAAAVLFDVLGTVFFAVTVAYLLVPVHRRVVERGVPRRVAGAIVTAGAVVGALVPAVVAASLVYRQRNGLLDVITHLPATLTLSLGGVTYTVDVAPLLDPAREVVSAAALAVVSQLPVLALKAALFAFLVFALLVRPDDAADALLAPIPASYHDVARRLHERTRATLYTIYVLQAATAVGTFLLALPVFVVLGYPTPVTLAFLSGVLQFLPIVGPSVVVLALAAYQLSAGTVADAVLVFVLGMVVIAGLPDLLIRPRLAAEGADMPGSLYFVGFVGGLLTLGAVGIIAGPLVVALLVEGATLLAAENRANGD